MKLAATARLTRTVLILPILGCECDLSVHDPICRHVCVEADVARKRHTEFHEEEPMLSAEAVYRALATDRHRGTVDRPTASQTVRSRVTATTIITGVVCHARSLGIILEHLTAQDLEAQAPVRRNRWSSCGCLGSAPGCRCM